MKMPMESEPRYRVIMSGRVRPERERHEVLAALAELFHSSADTMEQLLQGHTIPLKKEYERDEAERICQAILDAGADCTMEAIGAAVDLDVSAEEAAEDPPVQDQVEAGSRPEGERQYEESGASQRAGEGVTDAAGMDALMKFVAVNTEYYRRKFVRFGSVASPRFALSWHWPAFFAFFFWALYRKMWGWALVHLAGGLALVLTVNSGLAFVAWGFAWPLSANYLYFRHACRHVAAQRQDGSSPGDHVVEIRSSSVLAPGGTSQVAVLLGVIGTALLSASLSEVITLRMLEQYSEQIEGVLPEPEIQQRGDGSLIGEISTLEPDVARTSVVMKLLAASQSLSSNPSAMAPLVRKLEQEKVPDAWGNSIILRDEEGSLVLVSAGPDQRFDTEDDILQYMGTRSLIQE